MVYQNMTFPSINSRTKTMPFYVVSLGEKKNQNHKIRENGYIAYQIAWCSKGRGHFVLDGHEYVIDSGKGFYFAEGVPHEYYATEQPWALRWIAFNGNQTDYFFKFLKLPKGGVFKKNTISCLDKIFDKLLAVIGAEGEYCDIECSAILHTLMAELIRAEGDAQSKSKDRLGPIISYLNANYNKDLSLEDMAARINVCPDYFCKLFKQAYQVTPFKYLINLRVQKAKFLLLTDMDLPVKEVAAAVGFHDTSYFCSAFRSREGVSPSQFRNIGAEHDYFDIPAEFPIEQK
jgi:AraC family transcriptional regulator of arabinose operon